MSVIRVSRLMRPCLAVFAAVLCSSCFPTPRDAAAARASREFRCPKESVMVEKLARGVFRVTACGHQAIYMCRTGGSAARAEDIPCVREGTGGFASPQQEVIMPPMTQPGPMVAPAPVIVP